MTIRPLALTNDSVLRPLIDAPDEVERERALESVLIEKARPIINAVLGRMRGTAIGRDEADEIAATVILRLVRRLQNVADSNRRTIGRFGDFVARLTYNAVHDSLRSRFPQRTRLKNRLRYVVRNDGRFTSRTTGNEVVVALSSWGDRNDVARRAAISRGDATPVMLRQQSTGDAIAAALLSIGAPALLDDLAAIFADLWGVTDRMTTPREQRSASDPEQDLDMRRSVGSLWREIAMLPPKQRAALLLNMRDREGANAISLFVVIGVATLPDIAEAAGMTEARMWEIWDDLPLEDRTIAGMLGATRQQVINLRKSARERLARRCGYRSEVRWSA